MTPDGIPTYDDFKEFYENPVIKKIATNKRWTVSTTKEVIGKDGKKKSKMPIDMYYERGPDLGLCMGQRTSSACRSSDIMRYAANSDK